MKIIYFVQKMLSNKSTASDAMDIAIQRVTQKQQTQSQLILFKTDYLE